MSENKVSFNIGVGQRIFSSRKRLKMTRAELGKKVGLHESTVKRYEDGQIKSLDIDKIIEFARALDVSPGYLMGWDEQPNGIIQIPATVKVPLIGSIACGSPLEAIEEYTDEYVEVPDYVKADFSLVCKGDSMVDARINDGDIVCIKKQPSVENGEIAAVCIDGEATLKRVFLYAGMLVLQAANKNYEPMVFSGEELERIMIIGKATHFVSKIV